MSDNRLEYEPIGSSESIYLQQIGADQLNALTTEQLSRILKVTVPSDESDVMIGLLEGVEAGLTTNIAYFGAMVAMLIVAAYACIVLGAILVGKIAIKDLMSESDGKASMSRFQALVFTFVFAIGFMLILVETGDFPRDIPGELVAILAGSLATYLISKGMGRQDAGSATALAGMVAPKGRLLRYDPAFTQVDPAKVTPRGADVLVTQIPTTAKGPNEPVPVAVAAGACALEITVEQPEGGLTTSELIYADASGAYKTHALSGHAAITTPEGWITEVSVRFESTAAAALVKVKVAAGP